MNGNLLSRFTNNLIRRFAGVGLGRVVIMFALGLTLFSYQGNSQSCGSGYNTVVVSMLTDSWGEEISWNLIGNNGTLYKNVNPNTLNDTYLYNDTLCVPAGQCLLFTIHDAYGDAIIGNGYIQVWIDGVLVLDNPDYTFFYQTQFNCSPENLCSAAAPVSEGDQLAQEAGIWYAFTPDSSGLYQLTTCNLTDCDTRIWVFNNCNTNPVDPNTQGAIFYSNDACGLQASMDIPLLQGVTYYIRIGDNNGVCAGASIPWSLHYSGLFPDGCAPGESSVIVKLLTDGYGSEVSWNVTGGDGTTYATYSPGTYGNNQVYLDTVCIPDGACVTLNINDTYGDGLLGAGYWLVTLDGDTIINDPPYTQLYKYVLACDPGESCQTALSVTPGTYYAPVANTWYEYVPDSSGMYLISTCGLNICDTRIWVYANCNYTSVDSTNAGTLLFNDNNPDCGLQAQITAALTAGHSYYIRIGDSQSACSGDSIGWLLQFIGPVTGCTDPAACNFNPLATIEDGSCIPQDDPSCPEAPDLMMVEPEMVSSLHVDHINSTDACAVSEGCLSGFGSRDIIRFDTHIKNIGELDYFIGEPDSASGQFTFDNCHHHWHYEGYAEYLLYDSYGVQVPVGYKNGFCVLDLECSGGGIAKFGCGNMGITSGCGDIYGAYLSCQWIDVTDVPDGNYILVTRVNWDNSPDRLGRVEKNTLNNWAQACINLDRSTGTLVMTLLPNCQPYVDCTGTAFGHAVMDCNGQCNGTAVRGDVDLNGVANMTDAQQYVSLMLGNDITPTPCNDLSGDGVITVYDAALLTSCLNFGTNHIHPGAAIHNHCRFPQDILNSAETATFRIADVNPTEKYIDISIQNPDSRIGAYQFQMSGITIGSVENLVDTAVYPIFPTAGIASGMVVGISYQDSMILKSETPQPLCRIHYLDLTGDEICIDHVVDVINQDHNRIGHQILGGCVLISGNVDPQNPYTVRVQPNPFTNSTLLSFNNPEHHNFRLELLDVSGKLVRKYENITGEELTISRDLLGSGVYFYHLIGEKNTYSGKLMVD